jgi:HD-GYP domain-containing protein (c-di-GMP phosphodiesterase class II)
LKYGSPQQRRNALISVDRAEELGLTHLLTGLDGVDEGASRQVLSEVAVSARSQLALTDRPDPVWFDNVANLLLSSGEANAPELRIECLLLFAQWYYKEGKWAIGIESAEKAVAIARRADALSLQRRAYSALGNLHSRTKDIAQATVCYVKALEIAERIGDRVGQCAVIANLADARFNAGLLDESITLNRYVIDMQGDEPLLQPFKRQAHHNIALVSLILADLPTAYESIETAVGLSIEPKTQVEAYQRVILELTFTKILVKMGEVDRARERAKLASGYADRAKSRPPRIQALLAETLCDAASERTEIALARLEKLKEEVRSNEPALRDVLEMEVLCNNYAGRHRDAKDSHERYLAHLAEWQRKSAIQQVATLKRSFRKGGRLTEEELQDLPEEVVGRFRDNDDGSLRWASFQQRLDALAILAELRDDATGEHSFRVGRMAAILARHVGYDDKQIATIELAARLHDIGKLAVPDVVLLKKGRLNAAEMDVMRRHSIEGCQILSDVLLDVEHDVASQDRPDSEAFRQAAEIALHHHEWWNGTGYPMGAAGGAIPESARITALADVFDALTHARPYKRAWTVEESLTEIASLSGRQFDPRLCAAFVKLIRELHAQHDKDLDAFLGAAARSSPLVTANRVIERIMRSAARMAAGKDL